MSKFDFETTDVSLHVVNEYLSAGICDTCSVPKMWNTGDGVNEPPDPILWCAKMKREICPEPPEDRMIECVFYNKCK